MKVDETFKALMESVHESFLRLVAMPPVSAGTLPRDVPSECVYLFSEAGTHLYVGRTNHFRQRMGQQSRPSSRQNQAVFAFKLARELTGKTEASYTQKGSREALEADDEFKKAFTEAKTRVRRMELRFVEESDQLKQILLEIYVSAVLKTPYNDFETH